MWTEGTYQGVPIVPLSFIIILKIVLAYYSLLALGHISQNFSLGNTHITRRTKRTITFIH